MQMKSPFSLTLSTLPSLLLLLLHLITSTTSSPTANYLASPNIKFKPPPLSPSASIISKPTSGWSTTDCNNLYSQINKRSADKNLSGFGGGSSGGKPDAPGVTGMSGAQKWELFEQVCEVVYGKATPAGAVLRSRQYEGDESYDEFAAGWTKYRCYGSDSSEGVRAAELSALTWIRFIAWQTKSGCDFIMGKLFSGKIVTFGSGSEGAVLNVTQVPARPETEEMERWVEAHGEVVPEYPGLGESGEPLPNEGAEWCYEIARRFYWILQKCAEDGLVAGRMVVVSGTYALNPPQGKDDFEGWVPDERDVAFSYRIFGNDTYLINNPSVDLPPPDDSLPSTDTPPPPESDPSPPETPPTEETSSPPDDDPSESPPESDPSPPETPPPEETSPPASDPSPTEPPPPEETLSGSPPDPNPPPIDTPPTDATPTPPDSSDPPPTETPPPQNKPTPTNTSTPSPKTPKIPPPTNTLSIPLTSATPDDSSPIDGSPATGETGIPETPKANCKRKRRG